MEEIKPIRNAVHVCSLNTSAIKRIAEQAVERAEEGDKDAAYRLRWLTVAMEYNRQNQMQYIFQNLGSKEKSPKFRAVRMNPFWHQWKRESLRKDWSLIRESVDQRLVSADLKESSRFFESQRVELAARSFMNSDLFKKMPISDVLTSKPVEVIFPFQTPGSTRPGYFNQGYNYVESAALSSMSDVSDSETEDPNIDPWEKPLEEQFKEKAAERQFNNINFTQQDPKAKREENQQASGEHTVSRGVPGTNNPPVIKEEDVKKQEKKEFAKKPENSESKPKSNKIVIYGAIAAAVVLLLIFVYLHFFKSTPAPATPASASKKGWFKK